MNILLIVRARKPYNTYRFSSKKFVHCDIYRMMNPFWVAVIIVLMIVIVACCARARANKTRSFEYGGYIVNVLSDETGRDRAVAIMYECDGRIMKLLSHLRAKYHVGAADDECAEDCARIRREKEARCAIVEHLLRGFNYEEVHEHNPSANGDVAYSQNKGERIMLCLRDARNGAPDINALMFVVLHECAHIANYNEWGHSARFWSIFKYLLIEAVEAGVYVPVDYSRNPSTYCEFRLDHNPYFDAGIETFA